MHTTMQPTAVAIIEDLTGLGGDIKTLLASVVMGIMYLLSVASVWWATRSILKAMVAAVGGAAVLGVIASQTVLSEKTSEEIEKNHTVGAPAVVVRVDDRVQAQLMAGWSR